MCMRNMHVSFVLCFFCSLFLVIMQKMTSSYLRVKRVLAHTVLIHHLYKHYTVKPKTFQICFLVDNWKVHLASKGRVSGPRHSHPFAWDTVIRCWHFTIVRFADIPVKQTKQKQMSWNFVSLFTPFSTPAMLEVNISVNPLIPMLISHSSVHTI